MLNIDELIECLEANEKLDEFFGLKEEQDDEKEDENEEENNKGRRR